MSSARDVAVIGAGLDLGAGRRGVDMGPSAIRYAGLAARLEQLGLEVHDSGDIYTPVAEATDAGEGNVGAAATKFSAIRNPNEFASALRLSPSAVPTSATCPPLTMPRPALPRRRSMVAITPARCGTLRSIQATRGGGGSRSADVDLERTRSRPKRSRNSTAAPIAAAFRPA